MFIMHRCATNIAGQGYPTIEANCREASLTLWVNYGTSTHKFNFLFFL